MSVEADRSLGAQNKQRSYRDSHSEEQQQTRFTSSSSGSTPLHHGLSSGSCPALRRITFGLLSWEYRLQSVRSAPWIYTALMETMSPQQGTMGQNRSDSLTGESKAPQDNKKVPVTLFCRTVGSAGVLTLDTVCVLTRAF